MAEMNLADFPVVIDESLPPGRCCVMPAEIYDLIGQAKRGSLSWDLVIEEAVRAAKEGRIAIITDAG